MWLEHNDGLGYNPPNPDAPFPDWNEQIRIRVGDRELTDEEAVETLARFLRTNIGMLVTLLTGQILESYQRIMIKGWMQKNFSLTVAGRSFGKCINRRALVLTENGFKEIQHVEVGERIWAKDGLQPILAKIENPKERGFKVTTARGYECEGKVGHRMWVLDPTTLRFDWKLIEDLKGDEILPIRYGMNQWADERPLDTYIPRHRDARACPLNNVGENLDLYYVMGVLLGDGCIRLPGGSLSVSSMDEEVKQAFRAVVTKYMPETAVRDARKRDNAASDTIICNTRFKDLLRYMGLNEEKAHAKVFPQRMLSVNAVKMGTFLRGLFDTDGHCYAKHSAAGNICQVGLASSSYDIIKRTQAILLNYGILSTVRLKHKGGTVRFSTNDKVYETNPAWDLAIFDRRSLELFAQHIGFGIERKQAALRSYLVHPVGSLYKHNMLPVAEYFRTKYGASVFRQQKGLRLTKDLSIARLTEMLDYGFVDDEDKAKIRQLIDASCYYDRIKTMVPVETETIDIQVANEECYWSDGIISHNSLVYSHFCYLYCLMNPGHHILLVSHTFRSSRQTVERIDQWARSKRGSLLRQTFAREMIKRQDLIKIEFRNGSTITAVPLGDPDNLRGFRCNVLGIDEGLLIPTSTIELVLKPFLAGSADATKKQLKRKRETRRIKEGKMTEEEREVFRADSKMIMLSSASYQWEELYQRYKQYRTIIEADKETREKAKVKAEETTAGVSSYLVYQFSYEVGNPDLMDQGVLEEIREKRIPQAVIDREYKARFINEAGGFFSAKQMHGCTIPPGQRPCIEIVGDKNAEYVLGIDPAGGSIGADPAGDHFAMCVLKIVERPSDGRKIGLVVHQYACAGVDLEYHISYLHYILKRFNVVYIVIDSTGGEMLDFLNVCNQSMVFKQAKLELNQIEAEFAKDNLDEIVRRVKDSYNPDSNVRRIVHNQYFSSSIIKAGNDHLRACFEQKTIQFASASQSVPHAVEGMCQADVMGINATHPAFRDPELEGSGSMWDFVTQQDGLIELVKKECALIEVTSSPLGHLTYDLPHHMTRNRKNVNRIRRDSYSALWLAAWGLKILVASYEAPVEEADDLFAPSLI